MFDIISKFFHKNYSKNTEEPEIYKISENSIEFNLSVDDEKEKQKIIFEILCLKHDRIILLEIMSIDGGVLIKIFSKEKDLINDLYGKILKIFWEIKNV